MLALRFWLLELVKVTNLSVITLELQFVKRVEMQNSYAALRFWLLELVKVKNLGVITLEFQIVKRSERYNSYADS